MLFPSSKHYGKNHLSKWCAKSTDAIVAGQLQGCTQHVTVTDNRLGNLALLGGWLVVLETLFMWWFLQGGGQEGKGDIILLFFHSLCCTNADMEWQNLGFCHVMFASGTLGWAHENIVGFL